LGPRALIVLGPYDAPFFKELKCYIFLFVLKIPVYLRPIRLGKEIMAKLFIEDRYCKGCGICIEFCPAKILKKSKKMNSRGYFPPESSEMDKCKKCGMCSLLCPDFAIVVSDD